MTAALPAEIAQDAEEMKKLPRLEHWSCYVDRLRGTVYNHPRIEDGTPIITSNVKQMGDGWAQTLNTFYLLIGPERS